MYEGRAPRCLPTQASQRKKRPLLAFQNPISEKITEMGEEMISEREAFLSELIMARPINEMDQHLETQPFN